MNTVAKDLGIGMRGGSTRTGPLRNAELEALGLKDLVEKLSTMAGRDVHFMIYNSVVNAASRAPTTVFFDNTCD